MGPENHCASTSSLELPFKYLSLENNKNVMWPLWFANFIWFWNKFCVPMCFCSRILQLLHPPFSEKVGYLQEKVPSPSLRSRQPGAGNFSTPEFQHCAVLGREPPRSRLATDFFSAWWFFAKGGRNPQGKKKNHDVPKNWGRVSTYLAIVALYKSYFFTKHSLLKSK